MNQYSIFGRSNEAKGRGGMSSEEQRERIWNELLNSTIPTVVGMKNCSALDVTAQMAANTAAEAWEGYSALLNMPKFQLRPAQTRAAVANDQTWLGAGVVNAIGDQIWSCALGNAATNAVQSVAVMGFILQVRSQNNAAIPKYRLKVGFYSDQGSAVVPTAATASDLPTRTIDVQPLGGANESHEYIVLMAKPFQTRELDTSTGLYAGSSTTTPYFINPVVLFNGSAGVGGYGDCQRIALATNGLVGLASQPVIDVTPILCDGDGVSKFRDVLRIAMEKVIAGASDRWI